MAAEGSSVDYVGLVFVYGTLKQGHRSHGQLRGARLEGEARLKGYRLYDLGPFPMAVPDPSQEALLHGELYAVTGAQLRALDRFEGAPRLYERHSVQLADGRGVWIYVGRERQVRFSALIPSGRWLGSKSHQPATGAGQCKGQA